jgi:RHS repeat-associated protein
MIGGHSMGLIHMNGRVQDAVIGRFLSPDPIVQFPFFSQSFNRYSYVLNNPLTFTDPSGFELNAPGHLPTPDNPEFHRCMLGVCPSPDDAPDRGLDAGSKKEGPVPRDTPGPAVLPEPNLWTIYVEYVGDPLGELFGDIGRQWASDVDEHWTTPVVNIAAGKASKEDVRKLAIGVGVTAATILTEGAVAEGLGTATAAEAVSAARAATSLGTKIEKQMAKRGWSRQSIDDAIANPTRTVSTKDTRHLPGGARMDDSATAYYGKDGGYVVRNDRTGDVVQISDRNDPAWAAPWD